MDPLALVELLRERPLVGFLIGLAFFAVMFSVKNLVVYLYSRSHEKRRGASHGREGDS